MSVVTERVETWLKQSADGRIAPEHASALVGSAGIETAMLALIPVAAKRARPTISGYEVGAVGEGASGALYLGANFEFRDSALGQTVHAEQSVIANAASHDEAGLVRIAVSAPPCGHCRQFLWELATAKYLKVIIPDRPSAMMAEFLPGAFGPADLGLTGGLLDTTAGRGRFDPTASKDRLVMAAAAGACQSYAPYSSAWSAAAIEASDGRIFTGPYLENAAFNPSLPPVQAAYVLAALAGCKESDFKQIVVAQLSNTRVDHHAAAQSLIAKIAPHVDVKRHTLEIKRS